MVRQRLRRSNTAFGDGMRLRASSTTGAPPVDNNHLEGQIRPIAVGKHNWLFAGSLRAGQRAAALMTLVNSVRLNGHDPYAYMKDVLQRLPTQKMRPSQSCCRIAGSLADRS